tara:strand:- start:3630 stop:9230 length:5601 start_codon:yes stop_codon:yes gene_type:complete
MPEIKNTFTQGKMNKDLDERLVPKGQYVDAMNVEVATSEDSDVGTVQNIYGNTSINGNNLIPPNSVCVGSVVDNATDSLYWLTATDKIDYTTTRFSVTGITNTANVIFRYNEDNFPLVDPVFVDVHQIAMGNIAGITQGSQGEKIIFIPIETSIRVGMSVRVIDTGGTIYYAGVITRVMDNIINPGASMMVVISGGYDWTTGYDLIEFNDSVTGWDTNTLITGINIVDDMLFWTDNNTEPKKINITRSKEGTFLYNNVTGIKHTDLIADEANQGPVQESHITVIRPKPTSRIKLEMKSSSETNTGVYGRLSWNGRFANPSSSIVKTGDIKTFSAVSTLDTISFNGVNVLDYKVGDTVLLKASGTVSASSFPISEYHVKAKILNVYNNNSWPQPAGLKVKVLDVNYEGYPFTNGSASNVDWAIQKELNENKLFELKFPRFSYRWKFEDGEYSTFAPWSNVGFLPSAFQWVPKEGFNLGMVNSLRELTLFDFVPSDTPKDAIQVDILYRESDSPNVYIVDTLKPSDPPLDGLSNNPWNTEGSQGTSGGFFQADLPGGKYKITSETIFATVAPNQTLRNWDAVPRRALAQEVIGNRLTYANYVRNFNLTPGGNLKFKQDLTVLFKSSQVENWQKKSVKTLREYQVGIAYLDEYGRETPVFTNNSSVTSIPMLHSAKSNILYSKINHLAPAHANAYKFYVKENSSKYYNLVMDRWYDAEDGDIWLSFNSHDRSKVDEETFLYLKRGHGGNIIKDDYKYKILSIKNEAPEFIKNVRKQFGIKPNQPDEFTGTPIPFSGLYDNGAGTNDDALPSPASLPEVGKKNFTILKSLVDDSSWNSLNSLLELNLKNRVRFLKYPSTTTLEHRDNGTFHFDESPEKTSAWYKIDKVSSAGGSNYMVNLGKELGNDCLFVLNAAGNQVDNHVAIEIAQEEAESLPEFDGRFFVKVIRNANIEKNITGGGDVMPLISQPLYYFDQPDHAAPYAVGSQGLGLRLYEGEAETNGGNFGDHPNFGYSPTSGTYNNTTGPADDTLFDLVKSEWENNFGDGTELVAGAANGPKWFIDNLKYASTNVGRQYFGVPLHDISNGIPGTGHGIDTSNNTIDISFSGHTPNFNVIGAYGSGDPPWPNSSLANTLDSFFDWQLFGGNFTGFSPGQNGWLGATLQWSAHGSLYQNFVDEIKAGAQFRFTTDPDQRQIYGVISVEILTVWNYLGKNLWLGGTQQADSGSILHNTGMTYGGANRYNGGYPYDSTYAEGYDQGIATSGNVPNLIHNVWEREKAASDRRIIYRLHLDKPISGYDPTSSLDSTNTDADCSIEFVQRSLSDEIERTNDEPAVWETEPKDNSDIDIYYEASQSYPVRLTTFNISNVFSIGDQIVPTPQSGVTLSSTAVIKSFSSFTDGGIVLGGVTSTPDIPPGSLVRIYDKDNRSNYIELMVLEILPDYSSYYDTVTIRVEPNTHKWGRTLDWFNSYSFGNGVESDTIRDDFNQVEIGNGVTVSTTVGWQYEEERLGSGLIFSGVYNNKTGLNDLNQFIEAENITKEVNPSYGSIQKLHARDSDLVTFCEDKVLKILSNKDALYNADENPNLISAENVLGQTLPFVGDFGISKNPESFARENFRSYFTDKKRGAVLRLSRDGITPISENGMKDWFRDNLKDSTDQRIRGSYDNHKSHYNVSPEAQSKTVVFNESSKGWTSFRSFVPEGGESMNNDYFTFKNGKIFKHHAGPINSFYNQPAVDSTLSFIFNEGPSIVKSFTALNYEGTQSRVIPRDDDSEYVNLTQKRGWYVSDIKTDKQEGKINEFIEKEGKWFNHITGVQTNIDNIDPTEFSFQGVGSMSQDAQLITDQLHYGCELNELFDGAMTNVWNGLECESVI